MTPKEVKASIDLWKDICVYDHRYYFVKAMDIFYSWPLSYKREFLHFVTERCENPKWRDMLEDETLYADVLRCILNCFTNEKTEHPYFKKRLARIICDFVKSDGFKRAEANIKEDSESFLNVLEAL